MSVLSLAPLLFAAALLAAPASDTSGTAPSDVTPGTATLTLEGSGGTETATLSTHFATGYDSLRRDTAFVIYFYEGTFEQSEKWGWLARTAGMPETGTHDFSALMRGGPLGEEAFTFAGELGVTDQGRLRMMVSSNEGALTITSASADRIQGSFELQNIMGGTITGEFDAPRGTFFPTRGPGG